MKLAVKYFYCYAIAHNRFRYASHGREANKTIDNLMVPSLDEIPGWVNRIVDSIKIPKKEPLKKLNISLEDVSWGWIYLQDYFDMYAGKYYKKDSYGDGKVPLVSSSGSNNGVFVFSDLKPKYVNCLTIGKVKCSVYYQSEPFVASSDVTVLKPKFKMSCAHAMFLVSLINKERYKWSYGRQIRLNDAKKMKIKVPIEKGGEPDWNFMEHYIQSLPYSKNLEEVN